MRAGWWLATNAPLGGTWRCLFIDHYLEVLKTKPGAAAQGSGVGAGQSMRGVHRDPSALLGARPARPGDAAVRSAPHRVEAKRWRGC
jgi:hypothetical protein